MCETVILMQPIAEGEHSRCYSGHQNVLETKQFSQNTSLIKEAVFMGCVEENKIVLGLSDKYL
jgi:hypothetical protein